MNTLKILDILKEYIISVHNIYDKKINKFNIDSRVINENDVFIAIKGKNKNGNDYIEEAYNNGSILIITSEKISIKKDIMIIRVDDIIKIMGILASYILEKNKVPVIGITGSNGKTTTKELIYNILSTKYKVLKTEGNYNNHIGLPLTILNYNNEDIIVLEMGMNHFDEIKNLTNICKPSIGVITNIGTAHIGNLGSKKNIFKAKCEILSGMNNGFLVINGDDVYLKRIKSKNNKIIRCGKNKYNDLCIYDINYSLYNTNFKINCLNNKYNFNINIPGKYIIYDVLLAIQVGLLLNIDIMSIQEVINNYKTINNRINIIKKEEYIIIDDCYNASYESFDNILSILECVNDEKILIIGDIFELGKHNRKVIKKLVKKINSIKNKKVLLMGNNLKKVFNKINNSIYFEDYNDLFKYLENIKLENKIILVKASNGMHFDKIIHFLTLDKDNYIR